MKIDRFYSDLGAYLKPNRALVIFGPRRVGKTFLLKEFLENTAFKYKLDSGDNIKTRDVFGSQIGTDTKTVGRYLDLFEKSFILINLRGFSRNLRKEITKKSKYYFYDNGVRNAVISNFNDLETRNDVGALWENFLIVERLKKQAYQPIYANNYFWRTWDKREVDFVEEREGKLFGYEFKWGEKKTTASQKVWRETYKNGEYEVVTRENYLSFIT